MSESVRGCHYGDYFPWGDEPTITYEGEPGWVSYVVYPQEDDGDGWVVRPGPEFWDFWAAGDDEELEGVGPQQEWGWYAPAVEEITPEPPPRPTLGEIWGNERWGK